MKARSRPLLYFTFRVGITLKGIDGLIETIGGMLIWLATPASLNRIARSVFQHQFSWDFYHLVATRLLNASEKIANDHKLFASAFLISHGLIKVVLVIALWKNRLWAYPLLIFVFGGFCFYQIYVFAQTYSPGFAMLTVFDILIILLTWGEYREKQRAAVGRDEISNTPKP